MSELSRMEQQMSFIMEIDKLKRITRQTYISDGSRKENDTEHSWHLAMMCFLLGEYSNKSFDILKTIKMVLIHDIVEIDAGDTYAYDQAGNVTKREREVAAAKRLFGMLPDDQSKELMELWEEFEQAETIEAKFANTLDKVQPLTLNDKTEGRSWKEHDVHRAQVMKRNEKTADGSEALWEYAKKLIDKNTALGILPE